MYKNQKVLIKDIGLSRGVLSMYKITKSPLQIIKRGVKVLITDFSFLIKVSRVRGPGAKNKVLCLVGDGFSKKVDHIDSK